MRTKSPRPTIAKLVRSYIQRCVLHEQAVQNDLPTLVRKARLNMRRLAFNRLMQRMDEQMRTKKNRKARTQPKLKSK